MKRKKHRFVHPDPERFEVDPKSAKTRVEKSNSKNIDEVGGAQKDLKNSLISMVLFTIILAFFYFLDRQYNLFDATKNVLQRYF